MAAPYTGSGPVSCRSKGRTQSKWGRSDQGRPIRAMPLIPLRKRSQEIRRRRSPRLSAQRAVGPSVTRERPPQPTKDRETSRAASSSSENHDKRERDDGSEEHSGHEKHHIASRCPRKDGRRETDRRERRLHDRAPAVARPELRNGDRRPARDARRILDERDVRRRAREQAAAEEGDNLEEQRRQSARW
jgi:hypothetical protein